MYFIYGGSSLIIKVIGIIIVLYACVSIGNAYIEKDVDRLILIKEFRKMCLLWKGSIRHSGQDLATSMVDISTKLEIRIKEFLDAVVIEMKKMDGKLFHVIWKDIASKKFENENLKENDRDIVLKIGEVLGYLDRELQIENFEQYIQEFNNVITRLEKEIIEKKKLYKTVSIMVAAFIVIIFLN